MRIIHISDLHFGLHDTTIIEPFIADLEHSKSDLIIISGDLTQRALTEQYQVLTNFLQRLPQPILIVPGNHDIPLYNPVSRVIFPFKRYKRYISSELDVHFQNDEVNILGVNSVNPYKIKDGELNKKKIEKIKNNFLSSTNQLNILFFHHNINYFSGLHHPLSNAAQFIEYVKESSIHIICTGHLHYANMTLISKKKQPNICALLHAGSLMCKRKKDSFNSYYVIETKGLKCKIELRIFSDRSFTSKKTYELDFASNNVD